MVWKPMKVRRLGSKSSAPSNNSQTTRPLKSCLKVSPDPNASGRGDDSPSVKSASGVDSISTSRDHSTKSAKSILSVFSNRSKDSPLPANEENPKSATSRDSIDSLVSKTSLARGSQQISEKPALAEKTVSFGEIHIREHERVVGDNPSCSTGPPIAIGWGHGETRTIHVDAFEEARAYHGKQMVLSRQQREEMLLNWGISFEDIIDSIRTNIKVKNQRRQTVTNLGKVERFEEALESATRKLKRVLLRKSTGDKVKQLQEQAEVAAKTLRALSIVDETVLEEIRAKDSKAEVQSEGDRLKHLDLEVSVPDIGKAASSESKIGWGASASFDLDDHHTMMSGLSFGNSTSASIREMEKFYRDLEIEMFGDMPLPDMVGETLEVPGLDIPEEDRVYGDVASISGLEEAPSVLPDGLGQPTGTKEVHYDGSSRLPTHSRPNRKPEVPPISSSLAQSSGIGDAVDPLSNIGAVGESPRQLPLHPIGAEHDAPPYSLAGDGICVFHDDPIMAIRTGRQAPPHVRLEPQKRDSSIVAERYRADITRAYLSHTVTAMEQRYLHPSLVSPPPPPNNFAMKFYTIDENGQAVLEDSNIPRHSKSTGRRHMHGHSKRSCRRRDGPKVCHMPLFSNLSPTYWMEGKDDLAGSRFAQEPITITEESLGP